MSFVITGIPVSRFQHLVDLTEAQLEAKGIVRQTATCKPGFPCRVTLEDAEVGEPVLLLNYVSHRVNSPYRSSFAIYVRENANQTATFVDELPPVMQGRPIALRLFGSDGTLCGADLCLKEGLEQKIVDSLERPDVAYLHAHNAAHGCFSAEIRRAA
ncbi:MAG: DUF1203 domain-containing protein [Pseudomonadota bacterium]